MLRKRGPRESYLCLAAAAQPPPSAQRPRQSNQGGQSRQAPSHGVGCSPMQWKSCAIHSWLPPFLPLAPPQPPRRGRLNRRRMTRTQTGRRFKVPPSLILSPPPSPLLHRSLCAAVAGPLTAQPTTSQAGPVHGAVRVERDGRERRPRSLSAPPELPSAGPHRVTRETGEPVTPRRVGVAS